MKEGFSITSGRRGGEQSKGGRIGCRMDEEKKKLLAGKKRLEEFRKKKEAKEAKERASAAAPAPPPPASVAATTALSAAADGAAVGAAFVPDASQPGLQVRVEEDENGVGSSVPSPRKQTITPKV